MTDVTVITIMRESLMTILIVSAPMLGIGMFVGLIISIFQTTTSIQEQTLTFVPKIVAVLGTFALLFPWIMRHVVDFGTQLLSNTALRGGP